MSGGEPLSEERPAYERIYVAIQERFQSYRTAGPEHDEPWWDWLAVFLKSEIEADRPKAFRVRQQQIDMLKSLLSEARAALLASQESARSLAKALDRIANDGGHGNLSRYIAHGALVAYRASEAGRRKLTDSKSVDNTITNTEPR